MLAPSHALLSDMGRREEPNRHAPVLPCCMLPRFGVISHAFTFEVEKEEEVVSFDVSSLYTNVPVMEAIEDCAAMLYNGKIDNFPPVDKATFITLAKLSCYNVVMSTNKPQSKTEMLLRNQYFDKLLPFLRSAASQASDYKMCFSHKKVWRYLTR